MTNERRIHLCNLNKFTEKLLRCHFGAALLAENPDFGNTYELADTITVGDTVFGTLDPGDEDWLVFEKSQYGRYRFILTNSNYNWKSMAVYQEDEFGNLIEQGNFGAYYGYQNALATLFFEPAYKCYIKISGDAGNYSIKVEFLDTTYPDSYGDDCQDATPIIVDNSPTIGTLDHTNPNLFDTDWFIFSTQAMHKYQVIITRTDNSNAYFVIYSGNCGSSFSGGNMSHTLVSWFGEDYKLQIIGSNDLIGQYYTIEVKDLGLQSDDYGNTSDLAHTITPDGQEVFGNLQYASDYNSDVDWFVFPKSEYGRYKFTLTNADYNWKIMTIYQENQFGQLMEQGSVGAYYGYQNGIATMFFELAANCYIRVDNDTGDYSIKVEYIDTTAPDSYSNSCQDATQIFVANPPTIGTLDHVEYNPIEPDWFFFNTEPLHKYQITLTGTYNSDAHFMVYPDNCGNPIIGGNLSHTIVSWFGESYNLNVTGSNDSIGHYYTIQVTDLGQQQDDWPNIYTLAPIVSKDGQMIEGTLNYTADYNADVDWMKFTAAVDGDYNFIFNNIDYNWKTVRIHKLNEFGHLVEVAAFSAYYGYPLCQNK